MKVSQYLCFLMGKLSPMEGLGHTTAGHLVSGRVKSLAEGQHGIRQSYQSFLSPMLTCQMKQRTVTTWQNWCEVKPRRLKQAVNFIMVPLLGD